MNDEPLDTKPATVKPSATAPGPASPYCQSGGHHGCTCDICY